MNIWTLSDLGITPEMVGAPSPSVRVLSNLAPEQERRGIIFEGEVGEGVGKIVEALHKEGAIA
jgi:electron transfer flavoprotein alpha/beta subunit